MSSSDNIGLALDIKTEDIKKFIAELRAADRAAAEVERQMKAMAREIEMAEKAANKYSAEGIRKAAQKQIDDSKYREAVKAQKVAMSSESAPKFDNAQLALNGFDDTLKNLGEAGASAGSSMGGLATKLGAVGAAAGVALGILTAVAAATAAAGVGLFDFVHNATLTADRMDDLAAKTGTTTEFLSRMKFAAKMSGVEIEQLHVAMTTVTERAASAPEAFTAWGLSAKNANGSFKDTETLVREVSDRMAQLDSTAQRSALAMDLFGKPGKELVPLFERGSAGLKEFGDQADKLGITVSTAGGQLAAKFNDTLDATLMSLDGVKRQLATAFMPLFIKAFEAGQGVLARFSEWIQKNHKAVEAFARGAMAFLLKAFALFIDVGSKASYVAQGLVSIFTTRLNGAFAAARLVAEDAAGAASKLADQLSSGAAVADSQATPSAHRQAEAHAQAAMAIKSHSVALKTLDEYQAGAIEGSEQLRQALEGKKAISIDGARREVEMAEQTARMQRKVIDGWIAQSDEAVATIDGVTAAMNSAEGSLARQKAAYDERNVAMIEAGMGRRVAAIRQEQDAAVAADRAVIASAQARLRAAKDALEKNESSAKESAERVEKARQTLNTLYIDDLKRREYAVKHAFDVEVEASERAFKKEEESEKRRSDAAKRQINSALSADSFYGQFDVLMGAWGTYYARRNDLSRDADEEMLRSLQAKTREMASTITSGIIGAFKTLMSELGRVGDVETETRQRIAIKSVQNVAKNSKKTGEVVESYVTNVTEAQIQAYEKMGKKVEVVSETTSMHVVTLNEAMLSTAKKLAISVGEIVAEQVIRFGVQKLLEAAFEKASGASKIATQAAVASATAYATYAALPPLAGLMAGEAYGTVMAMEALLPMAKGGLVTGGVPGKDSVPAVLMPGEFVLPAWLVDDIRTGRSPSTSGPVDAAPMPRGAASDRGASPVTQNLLAFTTSRAQFRRLERDIFEPEQRRRKRAGAIIVG